MNDFINLFLSETKELLDKMNNNIIQLENSPDDDNLIREIFRGSHSLKGLSACEGFPKMSSVAHKMEDLLGKIRDKELSATKTIIDTLLFSIDKVEEALQGITHTGQEETIDVTEIENSLNAILGTPSQTTDTTAHAGATQKLSEEQKSSLFSRIEKGDTIFTIVAEFLETEAMKSVRAMILLKSLNKQGEVLFSLPDDADIKANSKQTTQISVWLSSVNSAEEIEKAGKVGLKSITVQKFAEETSEPTQKPQKKEPPKEKNGAPPPPRSGTEDTMRIRVDLLNKLLNNVGELLISGTRIDTLVKKLEEETTPGNETVTTLNQSVSQLKRIIAEIEDVSLQTRLVPVSIVFDRFSRTVRDLSKKLNKEIDFIIEGKDSELDKDLVDKLSEPLIHIIRNSLDHGIEDKETRKKLGKPDKGTVQLSAYKEGNYIVIEVEDDGKGINIEQVKEKALEKGIVQKKELDLYTENDVFNLLFAPGFSTVEKVSDVSGRGVGMDVVKKMLDEMKGVVQIESTLGKGCKMSLRFPLTLAIISSMLVRCGEKIVAIPSTSIERLLKINEKDKTYFDHFPVIRWHGEVIPLFNLQNLLWNLDTQKTNIAEDENVVIVSHGTNMLALSVEKLLGDVDIVAKPIESEIATTEGISGATILGSGEIPLILDIGGIVKMAIRKRDRVRQ